MTAVLTLLSLVSAKSAFNSAAAASAAYLCRKKVIIRANCNKAARFSTCFHALMGGTTVDVTLGGDKMEKAWPSDL